MTAETAIDREQRSLARHGLVGGLSVLALLGGLTLWAGLTEIAGAVVAGGTIVGETYSKNVQHREGGSVREILVQNGDVVAAGDLLLRLDDTVAAASLAVIVSQLNDNLLQEARLTAEIDGRARLEEPPGLQSDNPDVRKSVVTQTKLHLPTGGS